MKKTTKKIAIGTLVAGAAGYLTGILTAPKSGKETRKDIHDTAVKAKLESEKKLKQVHSELDKLISEAGKKMNVASTVAKKDISIAVDAATKAKEKAREALSAVHEGGSDDKDLQKAIKEANKAVDHLKKYLSK